MSSPKLRKKMGFKYFSGQKSADGDTSSFRHAATGGIYRPTWLIRTSDWKKVRGSEALNGYCALSYCWIQAYEISQRDDGKDDYVDNADHTLVVPSDKPNELVTFDMTFEVIVTKICDDFDIDYLWYDKLCIDQSTDEERLHDIQQMHCTYSNARYTVAIIPEMELTDNMDRKRYVSAGATVARDKAMTKLLESQWWKRSWTLLEMMMSKRMLLVGSNIHVWQEKFNSQSTFLFDTFGFMLAFDTKQYKSANQVLSHAHSRTSSIEHDKIFVMANIFHDVIEDLPFTYDSTVSTIANSLYRQIIKVDLSILCFGLRRTIPGIYLNSKRTMDTYGLPSWTGVHGYHISHEAIVISLLESDHFVDKNMVLHLNGRYRTIRPSRFQQQDQWSDHELLERFHRHMASKRAQSPTSFRAPNMNDLRLDLYFSTVGFYSTHFYMEAPVEQSPPILFSLTEDCDQDLILLPILFDCCAPSGLSTAMRYAHVYLVPVIRKISNGMTPAYKAVGVAHLGAFPPDFGRPHPVRLLESVLSVGGLNQPKSFAIH